MGAIMVEAITTIAQNTAHYLWTTHDGHGLLAMACAGLITVLGCIAANR